ncbi:MAG: hypothetical protein K2P81_16450 [Bacteriovoracaceae bacterium]|nr:hypothetical protein [Bacteriovoracaceae bacterium]
MKDFLNSFARSGAGVALSALFGLILLRLVSDQLGVEGIAEFGIYRQFIQFCTVFLSWGNGFAVIETYSKAKDKQFFTTQVFKYFQIAAILLSIVILVFSKPITLALFGSMKLFDLILFSPLVFLTLTNYSFFRFILAAKKHLLTSGLLQALPFAVMIVTFLFVPQMGVMFLVSYSASALISFFVWKHYSREELRLTEKFQRLTDFEKTSLATILTGAIGFLCPLIVKSLSVHFLGLQETGVIEAEFSLVSYLTLAIISGLGTYYLASVSEKPNDVQFRERIFLFLVPLTALALILLNSLDFIFLKLLFGEKIAQYQASLSIFSVAEMLRCINWFFIFTMIGLSYRKEYILFDSVSNALYVILSFVLLQKFANREAIEYAYLAFQGIYLVLNLQFCYKKRLISSKLALMTSFMTIALVVLSSYLKGMNYG